MVAWYFLKEVLPQFFSTMIVLCSIIIVSQLVRLSEVLMAFGLSVENLLLPFLYILMPFMTIVIPISYLFAVMVSFSRMSADGEFFAFLASGYSLRRAAVPILLVGVILFGIGMASSMYLEAWGRREFVQFRYRKTQTELDNMIKFKMQPGVFLEDFVGYVLYAEKISRDRSKLTNVMLAPKDTGGQDTSFTMMAPKAEITGSVEEGNMRMVFHDGRSISQGLSTEKASVLTFRRAEIDLLRVFQEQIFGDDFAKDDYRSYRPEELVRFVEDVERRVIDHDEKLALLESVPAGEKGDRSQIDLRAVEKDRMTFWKSSYLLYSRMSNPFAVIALGFFGIILGVQDPRRGRNIGYIGSIVTVICSYVMLNSFKWLAEQGHYPALAAAWTPHVILLALASFFLYQKNRLPPSESVVAFQHLRFLSGNRRKT